MNFFFAFLILKIFLKTFFCGIQFDTVMDVLRLVGRKVSVDSIFWISWMDDEIGGMVLDQAMFCLELEE
jgi:hypothetical protein